MTAGVWLLHLNKCWMLLICSVALDRFRKRATELLEAMAPQPQKPKTCALQVLVIIALIVTQKEE